MGTVGAATGSGVRGRERDSKEDSESTSMSLESEDQRELRGELARRVWR